MKRIDIKNWERKDQFEFFSAAADPFFSVTFSLDVTSLYKFCKRENLSFYYSLIWLCTKAANSIENFRYTIKNGEVYLCDGRNPSFTDLKKGSDLFYIVTLPFEDDIRSFCKNAAEKSANQTFFIDKNAENGELIYFSCLPWLSVTSVTNEKSGDGNDSAPRITWGKYSDENGRKTLGISVEANHRFTDGIHIGLFAKALEKMSAEL